MNVSVVTLSDSSTVIASWNPSLDKKPDLIVQSVVSDYFRSGSSSGGCLVYLRIVNMKVIGCIPLRILFNLMITSIHSSSFECTRT